MVIDNFDVSRIAATPHETDAPLVVDADAALSFVVALQGLEMISWRALQIRKRARPVQVFEFPPRRLLHVLGEFSRALASKNFRRLSAAETRDHENTVSPYDIPSSIGRNSFHDIRHPIDCGAFGCGVDGRAKAVRELAGRFAVESRGEWRSRVVACGQGFQMTEQRRGERDVYGAMGLLSFESQFPRFQAEIFPSQIRAIGEPQSRVESEQDHGSPLLIGDSENLSDLARGKRSPFVPV